MHLLLWESRVHPPGLFSSLILPGTIYNGNNGTKPAGMMPQHEYAQHTRTHIHSEIHKKHACTHVTCTRNTP